MEDKAGAFTALDADNNISLDDRSKAAGGWLLFISIICAIYEVFVIVVRFLNFGIVNDHFTIVAIVVRLWSVHNYYVVANILCFRWTAMNFS